MIRPLELLIGLRYTRAKRQNHFISFISLTSMLGIMLGVWALITVLSVMNGFERELRDRILGVASHITIVGGNAGLSDWQSVAQIASTHPQTLGQAPFVIGQGMIAHRGEVSGAIIRGIDPAEEPKVAEVMTSSVISGSLESLQPSKFGIILGSELAHILGADVGDKIMLIAPQGQVTPAGMIPRTKRFTVVGLFNTDVYQYDSSMAMINIADGARLFKLGERVSGIRLRIADVDAVRQVGAELKNELGPGVGITDWTREHRNLFRALQIEKRVMFIILTLIVSVAAFNIVSTLVMLVTDKQSDIAILRTIGLSPGSVMSIFMIQGTIIGVIGTLVGAVLGVLTALNVSTLMPWIESKLGVEFFPGDVYVISDFPAELHWNDVWVILLLALTLSLLATIYPAWRASRTQPAQALRYD